MINCSEMTLQRLLCFTIDGPVGLANHQKLVALACHKGGKTIVPACTVP